MVYDPSSHRIMWLHLPPSDTLLNTVVHSVKDCISRFRILGLDRNFSRSRRYEFRTPTAVRGPFNKTMSPPWQVAPECKLWRCSIDQPGCQSLCPESQKRSGPRSSYILMTGLYHETEYMISCEPTSVRFVRLTLIQFIEKLGILTRETTDKNVIWAGVDYSCLLTFLLVQYLFSGLS